LKEKFASEKSKETNKSIAELKNISNDWEHQEKFYFINELRPKSFREGKKYFDNCVEKGRV